MKQSLKKDRMVYSTKDFVASNEVFSLFLDKKSDIVWTEVNKEHDHNKYYENENYLPHNNKRGLLSILYKISQNIMFSYKLSVLTNSLQTSGSILDYGSGDGYFAEFLNKKNFNVETYDPLILKEKRTQILDNQYDIIMLWHVLEHIPDIGGTIITLRKQLKKDGVIIVAVPNRDSFDSKVYMKHWAAWDVPRHLYHFNHKSLVNFMKNKGFSLVSKHPLFLDSYYVSYLSSKYKKSFFPWISALLVGTISNILGAVTSNYSSSFYIFKKFNPHCD